MKATFCQSGRNKTEQYVKIILLFFLSLSESFAQAGAMVSSSAPSAYSVQALVLLAEVELP